MRLIYIAGKIQAQTAWEREQFIREAETLALAILKLGAAVHCPHTMCRNYDGEMPWEEWIKRDLEVLSRCNAIFMCTNWKDSKGATAEHDWAKQYGMKILYGLGEVAAYLKTPDPQLVDVVDWQPHEDLARTKYVVGLEQKIELIRKALEPA